MRDYLLTVLVFGALPVCIIRPSIGVLLYSWLSYMNPHRLTWSFAFDLSLVQYAAIATLVGLLVSKESKRVPYNTTVAIWIMLLIWMVITTIFAFHSDDAWQEVARTSKIQLMAFVTMFVMCTKERILCLVWVIVISLAFYGVKGGLFGILTGGEYRVWGPPDSFIADNNSVGLALIMTLPLLNFLRMHVKQKWLSWALIVAMLLTVVAILATHSRGALLGICAMAAFFWVKSSNKIVLGLAIVVVATGAYHAMPESWHTRMQTIQTYQEDGSAMGRITVWRYTVRLANQRLTGSGFRGIESDYGYIRYAPDIYNEVISSHGAFRAGHSIWFGMLGQHGWPGLILFVLLGYSAWRNGSWVIRSSRFRDDLGWCKSLAAMLQVSMIAYAAAGTFLSMEYFDLYYHVLALLILLSLYVRRELEQSASAVDSENERLSSVRDLFGRSAGSARTRDFDR